MCAICSLTLYFLCFSLISDLTIRSVFHFSSRLFVSLFLPFLRPGQPPSALCPALFPLGSLPPSLSPHTSACVLLSPPRPPGGGIGGLCPRGEGARVAAASGDRMSSSDSQRVCTEKFKPPALRLPSVPQRSPAPVTGRLQVLRGHSRPPQVVYRGQFEPVSARLIVFPSCCRPPAAPVTSTSLPCLPPSSLARDLSDHPPPFAPIV